MLHGQRLQKRNPSLFGDWCDKGVHVHSIGLVHTTIAYYHVLFSHKHEHGQITHIIPDGLSFGCNCIFLMTLHVLPPCVMPSSVLMFAVVQFFNKYKLKAGAPNDGFLRNICSERSRLPRNFDTFSTHQEPLTNSFGYFGHLRFSIF